MTPWTVAHQAPLSVGILQASFKRESGTTVAGALIRYQTHTDHVRNDVRADGPPVTASFGANTETLVFQATLLLA